MGARAAGKSGSVPPTRLGGEARRRESGSRHVAPSSRSRSQGSNNNTSERREEAQLQLPGGGRGHGPSPSHQHTARVLPYAFNQMKLTL